MSGTGLDYEQLSRDDLVRRLRAAELVCVLAVWAPPHDVPADALEENPEPERGFPPAGLCGKAANMALVAWRGVVGPEVVEPATRGDITAAVPMLATAWDAFDEAIEGDG